MYVLFVFYSKHGEILIADLWIPLDFLIFLSMGVYAYMVHKTQIDATNHQVFQEIISKSPVPLEKMESGDFRTLKKKLRRKKLNGISD